MAGEISTVTKLGVSMGSVSIKFSKLTKQAFIDFGWLYLSPNWLKQENSGLYMFFCLYTNSNKNIPMYKLYKSCYQAALITPFQNPWNRFENAVIWLIFTSFARSSSYKAKKKDLGLGCIFLIRSSSKNSCLYFFSCTSVITSGEINALMLVQIEF